MQCIVVKSDEFENSRPLYIFLLNPDYVAARSLWFAPQQLIIQCFITWAIPFSLALNALPDFGSVGQMKKK